MSYTVVTTKVDPQTKKEAMKAADALGIPLSVIIKAFLKQLIRTRSVSFSADCEEPTRYLLDSLTQSEEDKKAGRVLSFSNGQDALNYLDKEIAHEKTTE